MYIYSPWFISVDCKLSLGWKFVRSEAYENTIVSAYSDIPLARPKTF